MFTLIDKPSCSKELFFALSNSLQLVTPDYKSDTHKYAGLYAIYKNDICYYVGQSQNLASRLAQHLDGKYQDCDRIEIFYATGNGINNFYNCDKATRKLVIEHNEMIMMGILKPIENLITPPSNFEIDKDLSFDCFLDEDEDRPCAYIFNGRHEIAASTKSEPVFVEYSLMKSHNIEVIKAVKALGVDKAMEVLCHG